MSEELDTASGASESTLAAVPDPPIDPETERAARPARSRSRRGTTNAAVREITEQPTVADVARKKQSVTTGWADSDVEALQLLVMSLLLLITSRLASLVKDESVRGTEDEVSAVAEPLARIICRHLKLKAAKRGDLADILAITAAVLAYTIRVWDAHDRARKNEAPLAHQTMGEPAAIDASAVVEPEREAFEVPA